MTVEGHVTLQNGCNVVRLSVTIDGLATAQGITPTLMLIFPQSLSSSFFRLLRVGGSFDQRVDDLLEEVLPEFYGIEILIVANTKFYPTRSSLHMYEDLW